MANISTSDYVLKLQDLEFFQGDTISIPFLFVDSNDDVIPLKKEDYVKWYLCPFGYYKQPVIILDSRESNGNITIDKETNIVYINLDENLTENLTSGKYTQQPVLFYNAGGETNRFLRAEGDILFKPKIDDYSPFAS